MVYATQIKRQTSADSIVFAATENSMCYTTFDKSRKPNLLLALVLGVARIVMGFAGNLWLFPFFSAFILFI